MDFLVRFSLDTRLLKSKKYFTKKDFVLGLSNALSIEDCESLYNSFKEGDFAKNVAANFLLTKNPTARTITDGLIKYLALKKYNNILNNIIFRELLVGNYRTDVNLINGVSYTYEVKTARDKIEKAVSQTNQFKKVFEQVYLVTYDQAVVPENIDENIGIMVIRHDDGQIVFDEMRKAIKNTLLSKELQLSVLRKDELASFYGKDGKLKSREELIKGLLETETEQSINNNFKGLLKERFKPQWYQDIQKVLG
ncbi:MAG: sce7726 family protein [Candidatus Aenigmatarchaeota archaeon]